jgi:hypothetical protein
MVVNYCHLVKLKERVPGTIFISPYHTFSPAALAAETVVRRHMQAHMFSKFLAPYVTSLAELTIPSLPPTNYPTTRRAHMIDNEEARSETISTN